LKEALQDGKVVFGPFLKFTDPAVVEIMGFAGFDFVIIDTEHGPISMENAQNMIRAAESVNITPIIRVGSNDEVLILRALDIGAQGIEIPQINSKPDAVRAVKSVKYSPQGESVEYVGTFEQQIILLWINSSILNLQIRKL